MKKAFNIFSMAVCLFTSSVFFSACNKDEVPQSPINVLSSSTFFSVEGGEKEIVLAEKVDKVYAEDAWLIVENQGTKVLLKASLNPNSTSRSTLLVLKNNNGATQRISVTQEGIYYGLPQDQTILTNDKALSKEMRVGSNVPMTYTSEQDWIKVSYDNGVLRAEVAENTTGHARVGWITAKVDASKLPNVTGENNLQNVKADSLRVVQASIDNFVGEYTQYATTLDETQNLVPLESVVKIEKVNDTKAKFIVDNKYTWEIDFENGVGFNLTNGKIVQTKKDKNGKPIYTMSVIVADDYRNGHNTAINGTKDQLYLHVNDKGELEFKDAIRASKEQLFRGYGWNNYTSTNPVLSALQGIEKVYIQPRLVKK